jgi:nicotinate phosphoribosyltransferase
MSLFSQFGPLLTDLYELTMAAGYYDNHISGEATFSLFIRPGGKGERPFYIAAGLEDVLTALENFQFSDQDLAYLETRGIFSDEFIDYLSRLRFTGEVYAMPEGTVFFKDEPLLEVTAPIIEAQILESLILNTIGFQTMIATKAARCVLASAGRPLIDFSLRRTQGYDSSLKVARSAYLAGFAGTSNVLAGKHYGIPVSGTMAHSFVTAFDNEADSFSAFAKTFPDHSIFLIDTYDTLKGAETAVRVARAMKRNGLQLRGVRLDSGDMTELSRSVRTILDQGNQKEVKIFASGNLDEYAIEKMILDGAQIDAFGIGTKMGVSADAPYLDIVYKLVKLGDKNVRKLSPDKITLAGKKQVFRKVSPEGRFLKDIIGIREEEIPDTRPLLDLVVSGGNPIKSALPSLEEIRKHVMEGLKHLDEKYKHLTSPDVYPVHYSPGLNGLQG